MIKTADEFIKLRQSEDKVEQIRAGHETAEINVWHDVIKNYPEYKRWVIYNKTIPIEILELLSLDLNPNVRSEVARKKKINDKIFDLLSVDPDENVRYALMCNTKLTLDKKRAIKTEDSEWLVKQFAEIIKNASS